MSRPTKLTDDLIHQAAAAVRAGASKVEVAHICGITMPTYYRYLLDEKFGEAIRIAKWQRNARLEEIAETGI